MISEHEALDDEIAALNAIYGDDTINVQTASSTGIVTVLRLPNLPFSFLLSFDRTYPDTSPEIRGTSSTGNSGKGEGEGAVKVLRDILGQTYQAGQVCLFDLVEEAGPLLQPFDHGSAEDGGFNAEERSVPETVQSQVDSTLTVDPAANLPPPAWVMSEPLTINKSVFVARACPVSSMTEVTDTTSHLLATNKKVASATHNIKAWRFKDASSGTGIVQDYDDDGESAAGGRMLHLMQLMDVWNVLVIVTRWYGGVQLGPDRFRAINNVAREALVNGEFVKEGSKSKQKGKGKG